MNGKTVKLKKITQTCSSGYDLLMFNIFTAYGSEQINMSCIQSKNMVKIEETTDKSVYRLLSLVFKWEINFMVFKINPNENNFQSTYVFYLI